jgi:DtxR family Mn-dependent transcriptional regulator
MFGFPKISSMNELQDISPVMQDYLEAIYRLQLQKRVIRVRDIAGELGLKAPTVSENLRLLAERGLVEHERYEDVRLSPEGARVAQQVHNSHRILCSFLTDVLGVDAETAEKDACAIEHNVSAITMNRLAAFMGYVHSEDPAHTIQLFEEYKKQQRDAFQTRPAPVKPSADMKICRLSEMKPGEEGEIRAVHETGPIRKRLMEMGVLRGERVRFIREAPLGDPIEIRIRGYNLSLRKSEASAVEVILDRAANN